MSRELPPFWFPMQAVWSRKLKCWHLHDSYHRVPLVPVPCKTLEAVFRIAGERLSTYLENPVVGPDGEWIDAEECVSPHSKRCVHGLLLQALERRDAVNAQNLPEEFVETVCLIGRGRACCSFLVVGAAGLECAKGDPGLAAIIERRRDDARFVAKGDNCSGPDNFTPNDCPEVAS